MLEKFYIHNFNLKQIIIRVITPILLLLFLPAVSLAASLSLSPATGVYNTGSVFSVRVIVNTGGQSINAAEGTLKFNPKEITVTSIDRSNSIFNLWVTEPTFSNSAGTISFSGGLPSGYKGSAGTIFTVNFRTVNQAAAKVTFNGGSVLANDGRGTNILAQMSGGTYTIEAVSTNPTPEVVEYVAPKNTPAAPKITSTTHPDSSGWYQERRAELVWELPVGVKAVRTLLDKSPSSIPTKVYDDPIRNIALEDLGEGESYFHIQFQNEEGWGRVSHYRLGIDTEKPSLFEVFLPEGADLSNPKQTLSVKVEDGSSGVELYKVKIDNNEPFEYQDKDDKKTIELPVLDPGYHTVIVEAIDKAGNSTVNSLSFTISAFDRPVFTDYPSEINEEVIPVIRGNTRSNSEVTVYITKIGAEPNSYKVKADENGVFTFIPEGTLSQGVYELTAEATDQFGAKSDLSEPVRIAVQQPGFVKVGSLIINILSIIIPLLAMLGLLVVTSWFLIVYIRRFRTKVYRESKEVSAILDKEFNDLAEALAKHKALLTESKKTKKLNKTEDEMFVAMESLIKSAQTKIDEEISDVERLVVKK